MDAQAWECSRMRVEQGDPSSFPKKGDNSSELGVTDQCNIGQVTPLPQVSSVKWE